MRQWKKEKVKVTYSQVWWPILGIWALRLPIQSAHTQQWTHTVNTQQWTHTRSSGQPFMLRRLGSSWGFGGLLKGTLSWYWRWRECCTFTPPIYNSCWPETLTRNLSITSPTLTIRPRLPQVGTRQDKHRHRHKLDFECNGLYGLHRKKLWKSSAVECKNL